ncbi:MAG: AI-2E family transporter [Cyclobacteriaceae bacterium]|nr:AI-2E family transporter [Cyclobacteriaceae bacterium]
MISEYKIAKEVLKLARIVLWLILIIGSILILKFFGNLLKPLVIAIVFWYIIRVMSNFITKIRIGKLVMPDWLGKLISLILIIFAIYTFIDIVAVNLKQIASRVDQYNSRQDNLLNQAAGFLGLDDFEKDIKDLPGSTELRPYITKFVNGLTEGVGYTIIIIIYLIFILVEEIIFKKKITYIYQNAKNFEEMKKVMDQMNNSIKRYLTVKTFASFLTALLAYIVLLIIGVNFPLLWAFIIFTFNFIPYVGSFVATLLPSIFAALQYNSFSYFLWTFLFVQASQTLVANFIEPKIVGKSLNLSPLVVFVTLTVWGTIWGVLGMIIAVPVTSILVIVMAQFPNTRYVAVLLSESGDISKMIVPVNKNK